jgi:hypothetical protein
MTGNLGREHSFTGLLPQSRQKAAVHGSYPRPVTQKSDRHDDFADLLIRLKKTMSFNDVC